MEAPSEVDKKEEVESPETPEVQVEHCTSSFSYGQYRWILIDRVPEDVSLFFLYRAFLLLMMIVDVGFFKRCNV